MGEILLVRHRVTVDGLVIYIVWHWASTGDDNISTQP